MKNRFICILAWAGWLAACTAPPQGVSPVTGFEAERYMGKWYEIARLDHSFERGLSHVTADYTLNADGTVKVINRGLNGESCEWNEAEGVAEFLDRADVASLKVTFFWPFAGGYHVMGLDEAYTYALIAGPSFEYLWILSRTPEMAEGLRTQLVDQATQLGFKTDELIIVSHAENAC